VIAYYNEFDPYAAAWIRNLINAGLIAPGIVDERSIEDVRPDDLDGFTQCHFFAGLGGWSYALRAAGWPDHRRVWTASCPCQPYSAAGEGGGFADERHLWPHFFHILREQKRRPESIFGEQVASKFAEPWVDLVHADVEALGYAFGCIPFPSASIGAPHIRDRLYWLADADGTRSAAGLPAQGHGQEGNAGIANHGGDQFGGPARAPASAPAGPTNGFWRAADWLACRDGKWRPVEPGTFPLVNRAPARMGRLRAYGNAINVEQARIFIQTAMSVLD
jgi:DNA (cytosine-5)-methyltransferase 1